MPRKNFVAIAAAFLVVAMSGVLNAAELKLLRYGPTGEEKPGLLDAQGRIRDLSAHIDDIGPATLSDAALEQIAQIPTNELPLVQGNPRIGVPVTGTGKIIAIGFNYVNHAAEMAVELPTEPLVFMKATSALSGPFDEVIQPRNALKLDYESELVVVIGRRAQYISEDEVFDYIAGYTVGHDVSERAFQRERGGQFTKTMIRNPASISITGKLAKGKSIFRLFGLKCFAKKTFTIKCGIGESARSQSCRWGDNAKQRHQFYKPIFSHHCPTLKFGQVLSV